jgi:hypothetical protein
MTATERIRAMLDERGVEWDYGITGSTTTKFRVNGIDLTFTPMRDGLVCSTILTPEQAIEATLGRGEVERLQDENERLRSCLSDSAENAKQIMHEAHVQEAENAKLRELARTLYMCIRVRCGQCEYEHENACDFNAEEELRELGVEV